MFNKIVDHLEIADEFERNALRLLKAEAKSPGWKDTYIECLGDANRERAVARRLIVAAHNEPAADDLLAGSAEAEIKTMTLGRLLRLAGVARSTPVGSQRMRQTAQVMRDTAKLLLINQTMAQLLWWTTEVEPVPPGRPVIDLAKQGATR